MDDLRALADRPARGRDGAVRRPRAQPHRGRARVGARAAGLLPHVRGPRRSPTPTSARCPRSSPTPRPGASRWSSDSRWVWTTFNAYQWDLDYTNPDVFVAMASAMLGARRGRRRRPAPGRRAVPVEAAGHQLPEPARGPRAAAGLPRGDADRRARGGLQGRGDRRPARPRPLPRDRPARGQGVRPRLPQRAHGAAVERAGVGPRGADDEHAAGDAAGPARRRLADLRALPRRHRLGDHARGRRRASARTPTCTGASWPTSTPASSRARSRAARASSPTRARARRARAASCASLAGLESAPDEVAVELAIRRVLLLHAVAFAHGGLPLIYMGDELGLLNDASYLDDPHRRDDNRWMHRPADGLGGGRAPPRPGDGRGPAVGGPAAADRGPPRDARDPRPGRRPSRSGPATTTSSASAASRPASGCSCSPTSPPTRSRWRSASLATAGFALTEAAAEVDGRRARELPRLHRAGALPAPVVPRRFPGFRGTLSRR